MIDKRRLEQYCKDDISLIENYDEAINSNETYDCHHKNEIVDGIVYSVKYLIDNDLYYNRPANELIFLTRSEHASLHKAGDKNPMYGKGYKISGEKHHNYGKHWKLSEETIQKISESKAGDKNPAYGKHWYTNGTENVLTLECPDGFYPGKTHKQHI